MAAITIPIDGSVDGALSDIRAVSRAITQIATELRKTKKPADDSKKALDEKAKAARRAANQSGNLTKAIRAMLPNAQALTGSLGSLGAGLTALGPVGLAAGASLAVVSGGLIATAGAAVGAATTYANLQQEAADLANQFGDLSAQTNLQVETLQGLELAARRSGANFNSFESGLRKFSQSVGEALGTNAKLQKSFADAGVTLRDELTGEVRDVDTLFREFIEGTNRLDAGLREANGAAVLGRQFAVINQVLSDTPIDEYADRVRALGGDVGRVLQASQEWQAAQGDIEVALQGVTLSLVEGLNAYISTEEALDALIQGIVVGQGAAQFFGEAVGIYITQVLEDAQKVLALGEREAARFQERIDIVRGRAIEFGGALDDVFGARVRQAIANIQTLSDAVLGTATTTINAVTSLATGSLGETSGFADRVVQLVIDAGGRLVGALRSVANAVGLGPVVEQLEAAGSDLARLGELQAETYVDGFNTVFEQDGVTSFDQITESFNRISAETAAQLDDLANTQLGAAERVAEGAEASGARQQEAARKVANEWGLTVRAINAMQAEFRELDRSIAESIAELEARQAGARAAVADSFGVLGASVVEAGASFRELDGEGAASLGAIGGALQGLQANYEALFGPDAQASFADFATAVASTASQTLAGIQQVAAARAQAREAEALENVQALDERRDAIRLLEEQGKISSDEADRRVADVRRARRAEQDALYQARLAEWRSALTQAAVNGGLAATLALATVPPPAGFIAAGANTAAAAIQVGLIASNRPERGPVRHQGTRASDPELLGDERMAPTGIRQLANEAQVTVTAQAIDAGVGQVVGDYNAGAIGQRDTETSREFYLVADHRVTDVQVVDAARRPGSGIGGLFTRRTGPMGHRRRS